MLGTRDLDARPPGDDLHAAVRIMSTVAAVVFRVEGLLDRLGGVSLRIRRTGEIHAEVPRLSGVARVHEIGDLGGGADPGEALCERRGLDAELVDRGPRRGRIEAA